jgi:hypothetical protein
MWFSVKHLLKLFHGLPGLVAGSWDRSVSGVDFYDPSLESVGFASSVDREFIVGSIDCLCLMIREFL